MSKAEWRARLANLFGVPLILIGITPLILQLKQIPPPTGWEWIIVGGIFLTCVTFSVLLVGNYASYVYRRRMENIATIQNDLDQLHGLVFQNEPLTPENIDAMRTLVTSIQRDVCKCFGRNTVVSFDGSRIRADEDLRFFNTILSQEKVKIG